MKKFNSHKILPLARLLKTIIKWKKNKKTIVFTNGCFDLIHEGHIDYLEKAARLGDILIIGLNSDSSVCRLKGKNRPIIKQRSRAKILAALQCVDAVCIFNEETPEKLISKIIPDVLVKGGDYTPDKIAGNQTVCENGGKVKIIPFLKGFSTSIIVRKIKQLSISKGKL